MKRFILLLTILLPLGCSNQEPPKAVQAKEVSQIEEDDSSPKLTFTSGIRSMFEDSKGSHWFGSLQEGVCVWTGTAFSYFTTENGLSHNQVLSIQEDDNGRIWFGTQKGVSSFDGHKMTDHSQDIVMDAQDEWRKTEKDLWFNAGIKEGIYQYDGQSIRYLAFPNPKVINPHSIYSVTSLSKGSNGMLWMGTYPGVFGYDGKEFTIINDETLGLDVSREPLHIRSLLEDSKGRLWIGNNGIGVLLKTTDAIVNFSEKNKLIHPGSSRRGDPSPPGTLEHVFTIAEDAQGNIWFGDRDAGIWKYDGQGMTNYTTKDGLTNDFALSIYEDRSGTLWFGMRDGSVYTFNGKTFEKQF
ncbi:MAG: two-component regulator propeller domain-containing protein [Bacteroidota bacterium]